MYLYSCYFIQSSCSSERLSLALPTARLVSPNFFPRPQFLQNYRVTDPSTSKASSYTFWVFLAIQSHLDLYVFNKAKKGEGIQCVIKRPQVLWGRATGQRVSLHIKTGSTSSGARYPALENLPSVIPSEVSKYDAQTLLPSFELSGSPIAPEGSSLAVEEPLVP